MLTENFSTSRSLQHEKLTTDFLVAGGGISGICAAISAARSGIKVTLVQDRPVLGGNASSEVRLWILGATSHMGNNNRWAREGGLIDEILVENLYRNKEGNTLIFDTILLEKVNLEKNITLLLNTAVYEVARRDEKNIDAVKAFCSQNSTMYTIQAQFFCDASGDGILGFLAGASFRMGAETKEEFGEGFAPDVKAYGELLGHSIYFYTKDTGSPVRYVAPAYAHKDVGSYSRIRNYKLKEYGCRLWWVEYGGRLDTIHQSEEIKWELWKVIYGLWDHVKNSGKYPESENLTLEWVGTIPGKRESRRFEGDYMLIQQDIVEQRQHEDAVAYGGWAMDLHPADGVFSDQKGCTQWHAKGVYQIPYRCFYSKDLDNLFLAGRIISVSHVAFSSTRVMATCGMGGQVVGTAAALALKSGLKPHDLCQGEPLKQLQLALNKAGHSIPFVPFTDSENLAGSATVMASSELHIAHLPADGRWLQLNYSAGQMLPLKKEQRYTVTCYINATAATLLQVQLRCSSKPQNHSPDVLLEQQDFEVAAGEQTLTIHFNEKLSEDQYAFVCFMENDQVYVKCSKTQVSGLVAVSNKTNVAVSNYGRQDPPVNIGVEAFEFWTPFRRPEGQNLAFEITPSISCFGSENLSNGYIRPYDQPNAWVAAMDDPSPTLKFNWEKEVEINEIILMLDTDYDHPMESSLYGHPEDVMPFCLRNYTVKKCRSTPVHATVNNYQTINRIKLNETLKTKELILELDQPSLHVPSAIFQVLIY